MKFTFVHTGGQEIEVESDFEESAWYALRRVLGSEKPIEDLQRVWGLAPQIVMQNGSRIVAKGEPTEVESVGAVHLGLMPEPDDPTPHERAEEGSEQAAERWTPEQVEQVDKAIRECASRFKAFTTDAVWELVPDIPITKGIGSRLRVAVRAGIICNSGMTAISTRGGKHDHAQRLTVWKSNIAQQEEA